MLKKIILGSIALLLAVNTLVAQNTVHTGKILEFKNSGGYTYIKLEENKENFWIAIQEMDVKKGSTISVIEQMWMNNFKSKTLNETFDKILFATINSSESSTTASKPKQPTYIMASLASTVRLSEPKVTASSSIKEVTVAEVKKNKDALKDKKIRIIGTVVKVTNGIMQTNWIHIADKNDDGIIFRAVTSEVNVGDKISAEGTLNTDVDYGYGYAYDTIVVDSVFKKL